MPRTKPCGAIVLAAALVSTAARASQPLQAADAPAAARLSAEATAVDFGIFDGVPVVSIAAGVDLTQNAVEASLPKGRFYLTRDEASALKRKLGLDTRGLLLMLMRRAKQMSMPLIGEYPVGAAAMGESGAVYFGGNLEFPGFQWSQAVHAEQAVVANAFSRGETGLTVLAVSAPPCGHCRQFLNELAGRDRLAVFVANNAPVSMAELLPMSFGTEGALLTPQDNGLILNALGAASRSELVEAALRAANSAYSKYNPAGVALKTSDGAIFEGSYIQVAGANPSLSPLQAALVNLLAHGRRFGDIVGAALVECEGSKVAHAVVTGALLRSIAPRAAELQVAQAVKSPVP